MTAQQSSRQKHLGALARLAISDELEEQGLGVALPGIAQVMAEALGVARVSIWSIAEDQGVLRCLTLVDREKGTQAALPDIALATLKGMRRSLKRQDIAAFDNVEDYPARSDIVDGFYRQHGITSVLVAAIRIGGRLHGLLHAAHVGKPRTWTAEEQSFAAAVATVAGARLEKAKRLGAETAARREERFFRALIDNTEEMIGLIGDNGELRFANAAMERILGHAGAELIGVKCLTLVHDDDAPALADLLSKAARQLPGSPSAELRFRHKDGSWRLMAVTGRRFDGNDAARGIVLSAHDITGGTGTGGTSRQPAAIMDNLHDAVVTSDSQADGRINGWTKGAERLWGYRAREVLGKSNVMLYADGSVQTPIGEILKQIERDGYFQRESVFRRKSGETFAGAITLTSARGDRGEPDRVVAFVRDITRGKRAREAIRQARHQLRTVVSSVQDGLYIIQNDRLVFVNEAASEIMGLPADQLIGTKWQDRTHPDDVAWIDRIKRDRLGGKAAPNSYHTRVLRPDGVIRHVIVAGRVAQDYPGGRATIGTIKDITDYVKLQQQLEQANRMEAIGQLTGGIAHDFNNLLTIILGNAELGAAMVEDHPKLANALRQVVRASRRGAELTQRLLAFARKQKLKPEVVDIHELIDDCGGMLSRILGPAITFKTDRAEYLWPTMVDPGQLENVILNLCINARDAMPEGGALTVATRNARFDDERASAMAEVEPGDYVVLSIADTGTGMTAEVSKRAFEPFFTTKDVGKGTGLGLAMVYGFAKQSRGHAMIDSEPGVGTTVRLYLPKAVGREDRIRDGNRDQRPGARGEVVLVVEDDLDVRTLAVTLLSELGYEVMSAGDGGAATEILNRESRIDLLFSDMFLPGGMGGPDIAAAAAKRHPGIKVLFMSGHTERAVHRLAGLGDDAILLNKPFKVAELAQKLRQVLDDEG